VLCFQLDYLEAICLTLISRRELINNPGRPLIDWGGPPDGLRKERTKSPPAIVRSNSINVEIDPNRSE
jgi:hypothetical protein